MGISGIILACNTCGHIGSVHVIDQGLINMGVCAKCFNSIMPVGRSHRESNYCCYCEHKIRNSGKTWEHLIPISLNGSNHPLNLTRCCMDCNQWRGNKPFMEWYRQVEKFIDIGHPNYSVRQIYVILKNLEFIQDYIYSNIQHLYNE